MLSIDNRSCLEDMEISIKHVNILNTLILIVNQARKPKFRWLDSISGRRYDWLDSYLLGSSFKSTKTLTVKKLISFVIFLILF
jgi:hypothetical protein